MEITSVKLALHVPFSNRLLEGLMVSIAKYTVVVKIIRTLFSPTKKWFWVSYFYLLLYGQYEISVWNISVHFQTFVLPLTVIIQWYFCLHKESDNSQRSDPHRDLIASSSSLSGITWRNRTNWDRLNPEELTMSPRCFKKPTSKATVLLKVLGTYGQML